MRRGAKPGKAKVEAQPPIARKARKSEGTRVRDLEKRLAEALERLEASNRERVEALEQQTATAEILRVISQSPTDLTPVARAIAENAARLCDTTYTAVFRFDGELIHWVAAKGASADQEEALRTLWPRPATRERLVGRTILAGTTLHIEDVAADPSFTALPAGRADLAIRTVLNVPMLRDGRPVGVVGLIRSEVKPFSAREISLVQTFADQAVIAIENARLFNELQTSNRGLTTALDQQMAASEILQVISRSPTDVQPVFDAIAKSALHLCDSSNSVVVRYDGELLHLAAHAQQTSEAAEALRRTFPMRPNRATASGRALLDGCVVHIPNVQADPEYAQPLAEVIRARATLAVPMLRDGRPIGTIGVGRLESCPFSDKQIALLQTFADQAVIAIENVRLFTELQASNRELTTALDTQTATSEILRVISRSPTEVQPVFDAIVRSAARLCGAVDALLVLAEGDEFVYKAHEGPIGALLDVRLPLHGTVGGRAILESRVVQVEDLAKADDYPVGRETAERRGYRTVLSVPLLRDGVAIGAITIRRAEVLRFSDQQVELLQTFADQAVIAIENVRLFTELEARNRDLTDSLEQQTATAEILRVISSSPTDVQPVFDAVAESAARLCDADVEIFRRQDDGLHRIAHHGPIPSLVHTVPVLRETFNGRAVLEGRTFHVADLQSETDQFPLGSEFARQNHSRAQLSVPLMREGSAIGTIGLRRLEAQLFTDRQVALLQTFADQAVIAIENVRLFTELQASNHDLATALDKQTATSEVLRVISRSPTDVQPIFDAIVRSAVRLLGGHSGGLTRVVGDQRELAAFMSTDPAATTVLAATYPRPLSSPGAHAQAMRNRAPVNILDMDTDLRVTEAGRAAARLGGYQSVVAVPLLRHDDAIGALAVTRRESGGFSDDEIALLQTFADQAVIAIENARLLTELRARTQDLTRSVDQLTALGEVGRAVSSSLDLDTVLTTIVGRAVQLSGTDGGTIFEYDEGTEEFAPRAMLNADENQSARLRATRLRRGEGAVGQMAVTREPIQIPDIAAEGAYESRLRGALLEAGTRALLAIPLLHEARIVGGLVVSRRTPGEFTAEVVEILKTFAAQSALAIQNARLFREIEDKSRQLEVASQHKSEFLANMSHELRTPLNAIIGYSEMLQEEAQDQQQDAFIPDLGKINAAAKHLLELITDILDLSKIEAGRMELEPTDFYLPSAIDNAVILVRERAVRRGITLQATIDPRLGDVRADERKIKQVVLNLLSNAIKFTPEGGRIDVGAVPVDGSVEVSVTDTGVGIAPEDQETVFEEFRQVGTADKKVEGTGLGLALSRKFVELHGGRIWITSAVGVGSTFTFTLPVRREEPVPLP